MPSGGQREKYEQSHSFETLADGALLISVIAPPSALCLLMFECWANFLGLVAKNKPQQLQQVWGLSWLTIELLGVPDWDWTHNGQLYSGSNKFFFPELATGVRKSDT